MHRDSIFAYIKYTDFSLGESPNLHGLQLATYGKETSQIFIINYFQHDIFPVVISHLLPTLQNQSGDMRIVQQVLSQILIPPKSHMGSADRMMCLRLGDYCLKWVELPMRRFYWPPLVRSVSAASCVWAANKPGVTATYISSSSQDPASGSRSPGQWWSKRGEKRTGFGSTDPLDNQQVWHGGCMITFHCTSTQSGRADWWHVKF